MERKLTKLEFCTLANKHEELKRDKKEIQRQLRESAELEQHYNESGYARNQLRHLSVS